MPLASSRLKRIAAVLQAGNGQGNSLSTPFHHILVRNIQHLIQRWNEAKRLWTDVMPTWHLDFMLFRIGISWAVGYGLSVIYYISPLRVLISDQAQRLNYTWGLSRGALGDWTECQDIVWRVKSAAPLSELCHNATVPKEIPCHVLLRRRRNTVMSGHHRWWTSIYHAVPTLFMSAILHIGRFDTVAIL